jgi:hypothetical protein
VNFTHDVFADINPAYCALTASRFAAGFAAVNRSGVELPLVYLGLPLALSGDLSKSFEGTNKATGLLVWIQRSPQIHVGIRDRMTLAMGIVSSAVKFGCFAQLICLSQDSRVLVGSRRLTENKLKLLHEDTTRTLRCAERLGAWFAMSGSSRSVFDAMSLTP